LLPPWTRAPPKAVTGLANHPANKREWQWLTGTLFGPLIVTGAFIAYLGPVMPAVAVPQPTRALEQRPELAQ
jgi:hypothetical protein